MGISMCYDDTQLEDEEMESREVLLNLEVLHIEPGGTPRFLIDT